MNSRVEQSKTGASVADLAKYALALALVVGGLFAFYWFSGQWPAVFRVLSVIGGLIAGGFVFMTTAKGVETREFLNESWFELRKVVWPTKQEARQTTLVVIVAVIVMSLILAAFDAVIQLGIKLLLGS